LLERVSPVTQPTQWMSISHVKRHKVRPLVYTSALTNFLLLQSCLLKKKTGKVGHIRVGGNFKVKY